MVDIKAPTDEAATGATVSSATTAASTSIPMAAEVLKKQIKVEQGSPTRKRTLVKTASKDELVPTAPTVVAVKQPDDVKEREKEQDKKDETPADDPEDKSKRTRRSLIESRFVPGGTLRKVRKSLPVVLQKDLLKRRSVGRPSLSATDRKQSARLNKDIPLRSGRARKTGTVAAGLPEKVVRKRSRAADKADETTEAEDLDDEDDAYLKPATKIIKQESPDEDVASAVSDLESDSCQRSNSVSKCSDNSSNMDTPLHLLKREDENDDGVVVVKEEPKDILSEVEDTEDPPKEANETKIDVIKLIDSPLKSDTVDAKKDVMKQPALDVTAVVVVAQTSAVETLTPPILTVSEKSTAEDTHNVSKTSATTISRKTPTPPPTRPKRALVRPKFSTPAVAAVAPVVDEPAAEAVVVAINTSVEETKIAEDVEVSKSSEKDFVLDEPLTKVVSEQKDESPLEIEDKPLKQIDLEPEIESIKDESLAFVKTTEHDQSTETTTPNTPSPIKSPSPVELAVEGVSAISVKSFYGQPDFLENNPGIEDDPKLRDIVKEHSVIDEEDVDKKLKDDILKVDTEVISKDKPKAEEEIKSEVCDLPKEPKSELEIPVQEEPIKASDPPQLSEASALPESKSIEMIALDHSQDVDMADPDDKENLSKSLQIASASPNRAPLAENPKEQPDIPESPEKIRQKENHFLKLGLLTHHAAKIEKQKRRESIASNSGKSSGKKTTSSEYTGTLKTIIKLNRPSTGSDSGKGKKTGRQSGALKMTLHKARGKGSLATATASSSSGGGSDAAAHATEEDTYYTIQTEVSFDLNFSVTVCRL